MHSRRFFYKISVKLTQTYGRLTAKGTVTGAKQPARTPQQRTKVLEL